MARADFRKRLVNQVIEFLEENEGLPWQQGWEAVNVRPFNPGTGVKYKGGNVLSLMYGALERGSDDPRWMTFNQANAAGYRIAKGAKMELVEYWDWGQPKTKPARELDAQGNAIIDPAAAKMPTMGVVPDLDDDDEEEVEQARKPVVFYGEVFNGRDIVGLPEIKRELKWQPNELAEKLIEATGAQIEHRSLSQTANSRMVANAAYFDNSRDKIVMPPRASFKSDSDYYATALHELAHWTGHKSRLDRGLSGVQFGTPEYAREELRAEIAAMHLTSMVGVEGNVQNHARYASYWIDVLKKDKHELFRAAREAEKIVDHIFEYEPELKALVESRLEDNLLPKQAPPRKRDSGVQALPNFMPLEVANEPSGSGRNDSRWASFETAVRGEAKKYDINDGTVDATFALFEPRFTEVMDTAKRNGYSVDDVNTMLVTQLVEEMRLNKEWEQQWDKFASQVRVVAGELVLSERIEVELQKLHQEYQRTLQLAGQNGQDKKQTVEAVRNVIYGEGGRQPITAEFVRQRFLVGAENAADIDADDDDEELLVPTQVGSLILDDAMPADAAAMDDDPIGAQHDAKNHETNMPYP